MFAVLSLVVEFFVSLPVVSVLPVHMIEYFALLLSVEKYTVTVPAVFAAPDPCSCRTQHLRQWSSYLQLRLTDRVPHVQQLQATSSGMEGNRSASSGFHAWRKMLQPC